MVLWRYGIRFRYVTLRPRVPGHAGHVYIGGGLRELVTEDELETEMRICAAARSPRSGSSG